MNLNPLQISSLQGIELKAKTIVEGFLSGLHKSPYQGFSVEFSEYRNYNPGDPLKYVDWKIFGKTDKLMIKKFEAETNLQAHFIFDISSSMDYKYKSVSKIEYAKTLLAAMAYMLVRQNDAVGLMAYHQELVHFLKAKTGRSHLNTLLHMIDEISIPKSGQFTNLLDELIKRLDKKSLLVFYTDFLHEDCNLYLTKLQTLKRMGHDIIIYHIVNESEIKLPFNERIIFIDSETKEEIDINSAHVKDRYELITQQFLDHIRTYFQALATDYFVCYTNQSYDKYLLELMRRRAKKK